MGTGEWTDEWGEGGMGGGGGSWLGLRKIKNNFCFFVYCRLILVQNKTHPIIKHLLLCYSFISSYYHTRMMSCRYHHAFVLT